MPPDFTVAIVSSLIVALLVAFGALITARYRPEWEEAARTWRRRWPVGAFAIVVVVGAAVGALLTALAFAALSSSGPEILIFYQGRPLDGAVVKAEDRRFSLTGIEIRNEGEITTAPPILTLWFSEVVAEGGGGGRVVSIPGPPEPPVDITRKWDGVASTSNEFKTQFQSGMVRALNAHEPWVSPRFEGRFTRPQDQGPLPKAVKCRVQVFYGGSKPAEAHFTIQRPSEPSEKQ